MNKIYRLVRNASTGQWAVASELASRRGKSGGSGKTVAALMAVMGMAGLSSQAAQAQAIIDGGNTVNVPSGALPSPWTVPGTGYLTVGNTGSGTLNIEAGGSVSSKATDIGKVAGSSGTVSVSGDGSSWTTTSGTVNIGYGGTGAVIIKDGALLNTPASAYYLGFNPGSSGSLTVSNATWTNTSYSAVNIGWKGEGALNILDGGVVTNQQSYIGNGTGSVGTVTVSGAGSRWNSQLTVGYNAGATGTLNIEGGGVVSGNGGNLGWYAGSSGTVNVSGTDAGGNASTWTLTSSPTVGYYGRGELNITDGGLVTSDSTFNSEIGREAGSSGTVNVSNGSWVNAAKLYIGYNGNGSLNIGAGGTVFNGTGIIGNSSTSSGQVTVSGTGASWTNAGTLTVGNAGPGALTIADGGVVAATATTVAVFTNGQGAINIGAATGNAAVAPGTLTSSAVSLGVGGSLLFNHTDTSGDYRFDPLVTGAGILTQAAGSTLMTAKSTYSGATTISGGTLAVGATNALSPNSAFAVQAGGTLDLNGFIQKLAALSNAGSVLMGTDTGVGRTLTVTGAYTSNGGSLYMNAALNDAASVTDKLVAGSVLMGSGATQLHIGNQGGQGAITAGNGIEVVHVNSPAASAAGAFVLGGRVTAGAYEYTLVQNGVGAAASDGNWYLRNTIGPTVPPPAPPSVPLVPLVPAIPTPPPVPPTPPSVPLVPLVPAIPTPPSVPLVPLEPAIPTTPPVPPTTPEEPSTPSILSPPTCDTNCAPQEQVPQTRIYRPEPFAYLANQIAANGMFQHTLHDRLGEPNFAERGRDDDKNTSAWVRVQGHQLDTRTAGQIATDIDSWMVQGGVELGRWSAGDSRFHLGGMVGTGRSTARVDSEITGYKAIGRVKGSSLGLYGTWYANAAEPTGLYVDSWLQYGRYDNEVNGDYQVKENYTSSNLAFSLEAGYAFELRSNERSALYIEPQAQVILTDYSSDHFTEVGGMDVRAAGDADVLTRLGARLYGHSTDARHNKVQPFLEANWWHAAQEATMHFDGQALDRVLPRDRYEVKVGAQMELGGGWTGWGNFGYQQGSSGYRDVNGQVGVKLSW